MTLQAVSEYMLEAIRLGGQGMARGDGGPFGAVIVRDKRIVGRGWNRVLADKDPTAHAEITAIRDACRRLGHHWLPQCRIYVSCEPCPMCLAAIYWARIETIVYGADRKDAAAIGFLDQDLYRQLALPADQRSLTVVQEGREAAVAMMRPWPDLAPALY